MKKIVENLRIKNVVKVIICIVAISACVSCHMKSIEIEQRFRYDEFKTKPYLVSTSILDYNANLANFIIYTEFERCQLNEIDSIMQKQYRRAEKAKTILKPLVKH